MSEVDDRFRSRKFIIAAGSGLIVSLLAGFAMVCHVADATGAALVMGAWTAADGVILKLYNDANLSDPEG